ncbi:MAG TPA: gel scht [Duganella sp.]|nr:gel scht [Duganella sp.]
MKTTLFSIAAALALTSMSVAHAEDSSVQIKARSAHYYVAPAEFADFRHAYELTNGQILQFTQNGNQYYTQVDKGARVRMFAVSPTVFVTEEGTRIIFSDEGESVGVSNFEKLPMAAKLPANTMMMARR